MGNAIRPLAASFASLAPTGDSLEARRDNAWTSLIDHVSLAELTEYVIARDDVRDIEGEEPTSAEISVAPTLRAAGYVARSGPKRPEAA